MRNFLIVVGIIGYVAICVLSQSARNYVVGSTDYGREPETGRITVLEAPKTLEASAPTPAKKIEDVELPENPTIAKKLQRVNQLNEYLERENAVVKFNTNSATELERKRYAKALQEISRLKTEILSQRIAVLKQNVEIYKRKYSN